MAVVEDREDVIDLKAADAREVAELDGISPEGEFEYELSTGV